MDEVTFTKDEMLAVIEDLARIVDDLQAGGEEVNSFLLDKVVDRLLDRTIWGS
jgi:hypothetical protein